MQITPEGQQDFIRSDYIKRAILRSDLAPIPLTLELSSRVDDDSVNLFDVGRVLTLYGGEELEIIKSEIVQTGKIQGAKNVKVANVIAVLKPVAKTSFLQQKTIAIYNGTLTEAYQAAGARLKGVIGDITVPRFVCMRGDVPTFHISRALQEGGAVVRWNGARLEILRLSELPAAEAVVEIADGLGEMVSSEFKERHAVATFTSTDSAGKAVIGDNAKERIVTYVHAASESALRKMSKVLILDRVVRYSYAPKICAGDTVKLVPSGEQLIVMTAATVFDIGSDGGVGQQFTKLWLGRVK
ncbi:MAG: hypothetical protein ACRCWB_11570 [Enterovibrio sp.]